MIPAKRLNKVFLLQILPSTTIILHASNGQMCPCENCGIQIRVCGTPWSPRMRRAILRRESHTHTADSLAMVPAIDLETSPGNRRKAGHFIYMWKLTTHSWKMNESKKRKKLKNFLQTNENENTTTKTYRMQWKQF